MKETNLEKANRLKNILIMKEEQELKKLGFKKKWLSDKSGYWFQYSFKIKDLKLKFIVEDHKYFELELITKDDVLDVKKFKCTMNNIKKQLKYYTT